jgi:hypothetical protein
MEGERREERGERNRKIGARFPKIKGLFRGPLKWVLVHHLLVEI